MKQGLSAKLRRSPRPRGPRVRTGGRRGFTLIELLVVIGIIAVLASLVLAATSRARDLSQRVTCANNLRQIMLAINAYAAQSSGYLPFPNDDSSNAQWRASGWLYNDLRGRPLRQDQVRQGVIWQFLNDERYYHCPADSAPYLGLVSGRNSHELTSYQMNWAVGEFGHGKEVVFTAVPAFRLARMPPHGIIIWEGDEHQGNVDMWSDGTNNPSNGLTRRHGSGATVVRFDGSSTWLTRVEFDLMAASSKRNALWCNPNSTDGH